MKRLALVSSLLLLPLVVGAQPARRHRSELAVADRRATDHADSLEDIAAIFMKKEQWDRAIAVLDEARARRPGDNDLLGDLVVACLHSESCAPRRLPLLREALEKVPEPGELLEDFARELVRLGQGARVLAELRAFVQRHPKDDDARALVIDNAVDKGQPKVALEELAVYVKRRPDDVQRRALYVELLRGSHQESASDRQLHALRRAYPNSVSTLCLGAQRLLDGGDVRAADRQLERARAVAARNRAQSERICKQEEDADCLAELQDDAKLVAELAEDIRKTREEHYRNFRSDVSVLDQVDDLQREQDRDP